MHVTMCCTEDRRLDRRARVRGSRVREVHQLWREGEGIVVSGDWAGTIPRRRRCGPGAWLLDISPATPAGSPSASCPYRYSSSLSRSVPTTDGRGPDEAARLTLAKFGSKNACSIEDMRNILGRFISFTRLSTRRQSLVYRIPIQSPLRPPPWPSSSRSPPP